jgi:hypothetical protein
MGLHFLEDIAEWLRSERVADYLAYNFTNKTFLQIKDRTLPMATIGRKLEKLARSFAVLGGPNGYLLAKFTVEFEADQAAVRAALLALNPLDFPALDDFDASKLAICEPPTMASVEGALVHCLRLVQARFALTGTPFLISTEYSGVGSIGAWVEGVRNVHATLNWIHHSIGIYYLADNATVGIGLGTCWQVNYLLPCSPSSARSRRRSDF